MCRSKLQIPFEDISSENAVHHNNVIIDAALLFVHVADVKGLYNIRFLWAFDHAETLSVQRLSLTALVRQIQDCLRSLLC